MKFIKKLKVVKGTETYEESFERNINALIDEGYQPLGTTKFLSRMTKNGGYEIVFYQVMILVEKI